MVDSLPVEGAASSLLGPPRREENEDDDEGGARLCTNNDDGPSEDDDDDDDDSDSGSDSDEEQDENDVPPAPSLTEIREMKLKRNQAKLEELGLSNLMKRRRRSSNGGGGGDGDGQRKRLRRGRRRRGHAEDPHDSCRRGMLLPFGRLDPACGGPSRHHDAAAAPSPSAAAALHHHEAAPPEPPRLRVDQLYDKYPHRHSQIRKLLGLLRPTPSGSCGDGAGEVEGVCTDPALGDPRWGGGGAPPPPIFVVGPRGTGKTSVVRDVLEALRSPDDDKCLVAAFVDCSALDAPTVGDVTRTLFRQLQHHVQKEEAEETPSSSDLRPGRDSWGDRGAVHRDMEAGGTGEPQEAKTLELDSLVGDEDQNTANGSVLGRPSNRMNGARSTDSTTRAFRSSDRVEGPPLPSDASVKPAGPGKAPAATASLSAPSHTAVAKFARDLRTLLNGTRQAGRRRPPPRQVVLVLDQADRLLTLPRMGSAEPPNYLAQLMLVPRLTGVRVTVLAITTSNLLVHSRMDPLESTIAETFQPICVRFQNYNTKSMLIDVLRQEHMRAAVTGSALAPTSSLDFRPAAYDSFADTLVQSMQTVTTNVKEISHLGQRLWPKYIEPLSSRESIVATLQQARQNLAASECAPTRDSMQRELLLILGRLFRPVLIAATASCAYGFLQPELQTSQISTPNQYFGLPSLAKYMLLSAYLCQVNRPERDTDLFSIESNGKRRRSNADSQHQDPEEMGGTASIPSTNLPRPRTFALERMISVYASVVGLATASSADDDRCRTLGGAAFYDNLSHLCDSGLLHEHPSQSGYEMTRLNDPRYSTSISADDAKAMAKSLTFPLDSYIL